MEDPVSAAHAAWIDHGWAAAADGMSAVLELVRAQRIVLDRIDLTLRPFDLTFARYEILMLLTFERDGALSVGNLAEQLQVHSPSVTSVVHRLQQQGLVDRVRTRRDGRVVMVQITPEGRRLATTATHLLNERVFMELGLTKTDGARLWSVLRSLRANAGDFDVVSDRAQRTG